MIYAFASDRRLTTACSWRACGRLGRRC